MRSLLISGMNISYAYEIGDEQLEPLEPKGWEELGQMAAPASDVRIARMPVGKHEQRDISSAWPPDDHLGNHGHDRNELAPG